MSLDNVGNILWFHELYPDVPLEKVEIYFWNEKRVNSCIPTWATNTLLKRFLSHSDKLFFFLKFARLQEISQAARTILNISNRCSPCQKFSRQPTKPEGTILSKEIEVFVDELLLHLMF